MMNEDAPPGQPRMIRTASGLKPLPSQAERRARSRQIAKAVLLEAGHDPATIEDTVTKFLTQPIAFDLPSNEELLKGDDAGA